MRADYFNGSNLMTRKTSTGQTCLCLTTSVGSIREECQIVDNKRVKTSATLTFTAGGVAKAVWELA